MNDTEVRELIRAIASAVAVEYASVVATGGVGAARERLVRLASTTVTVGQDGMHLVASDAGEREGVALGWVQVRRELLAMTTPADRGVIVAVHSGYQEVGRRFEATYWRDPNDWIRIDAARRLRRVYRRSVLIPIVERALA